MSLNTESPNQNPIKSIRPKINPWYLALTIAIAALLLYLAIKGTNWNDIVATFNRIQPVYLILTCILASLSVFFRAFRWAILLSAEKRVNPLTMFWATSIGYLGNDFLPARAGEVIRSVMLGEKAGISKSYVFATAMTDRIFDVFILVMIALVEIPTMPNLPDWLPQAMRVMTFLGIAALAVMLIAPKFENLISQTIEKLPLPEKVKSPLMGMIKQFLMGARCFLHPGRAIGYLLMSIIVWSVDGINAVVLAKAMNLPLTFGQALLLMVGLGLGSAVPSTPGYVGIYQFVATTLMPLFGLTRSQSLTYILTSQANSIVVIIFWSLIGFWQLNRIPSLPQEDKNNLV